MVELRAGDARMTLPDPVPEDVTLVLEVFSVGLLSLLFCPGSLKLCVLLHFLIPSHLLFVKVILSSLG